MVGIYKEIGKKSFLNFYKNFKATSFSEGDLVNFLNELDNDFKPSFIKRLRKKSDVKSVEEYIKKILHFGEIILCYSEHEIKGIIGFYANDYINNFAYVSYLGIKKGNRGNNIGSNLLKETINEVEIRKIFRLRVETWAENTKAISFYEGNGFRKVGNRGNDVIFELNFKRQE